MTEKEHRRGVSGRRRTGVGKAIYALAVIILGAAILIVSFLLIFFVQNIKVSGNNYSDSYEIARMVQNDRYSFNSVYVWIKYKMGRGEMLPCLEDIEVSLSKPWELSVTVREKAIVGYVFVKEAEYACFDKEGQIVRISSEGYENIPCVEGLEVTEDVRLYDDVTHEDEALIGEIVETCVYFAENDFPETKITVRDGKIYVYFEEICVSLGTSVTEEQMNQIQPALAEIDSRKGTLHLEYYSSSKKTLTFDVGTIFE